MFSSQNLTFVVLALFALSSVEAQEARLAGGRALKNVKSALKNAKKKKGKVGKQLNSSSSSSSSDESPSVSKIDGRYNGVDFEDGTTQTLSIFCQEGICDITLLDLKFTTCTLLSGGDNYFGGIAFARGISEDSLDAFDLNLYCLAEGDLEIDIDNDEPIANLKGDLLFLEDGTVRRTGTGFLYFNTLKENSSTSLNGSYSGSDTEDGSGNSLQIFCEDGLCDVILGDSKFSTCTKITGNPFLGGRGIAKNIPEDSLGDFTIDLFCLREGAIEFDDVPVGTLTGNIRVLQNGVIQRTGPGFLYYKTSDESTSVVDPTGYYFNTASIKNGAQQNVNLVCTDGKCDVQQLDSSFPICLEQTGVFRLGGVAIARGIDQNSLDDFTLDLYCATFEKPVVDIDLDEPTTTIPASLVLLEGGIFRDLITGENFFNSYSGNDLADKESSGSRTAIYNGLHTGIYLDSGFPVNTSIYCANKKCEIAFAAIRISACVGPTGEFIFNGSAFVKDVPEDSLDNFNVDVYCLKFNEQFGKGVDVPTFSRKGDFRVVQSHAGMFKASDPAETTSYIQSNLKL